MLVDYHCHSSFSRREIVVIEGLNTPEEIVKHAKKLRLGAVGITDHDSIEGTLRAKKLERKYGVVVITGEEVTTKSGHVLALGITEWIKPGMGVEETVDEIHSQGGVAVAPHPFDLHKDGIREKAVLCDAMEGFSALNVDRVSNKKGQRFGKKHGMIMLAGSDAHCLEMMNRGVISVKAEDMDGILKAIRKGDVSIAKTHYQSAKIIKDWSARRLILSYDNVLRYINENYIWPKRVVSAKLLSLVSGYPRLHINVALSGITYLSLGATITYSALREVGSRVSETFY